jgi:hypothetical protein
MPDCVVTVPKTFRYEGAPGKVGLAAWIAEGDPAGTAWSGQLWSFSCYGMRPKTEPGERVYIVCEGQLRGYAPLVRLECYFTGPGPGPLAFIRGGDAVALTLPRPYTGFRGWKYRDWEREEEIPVEAAVTPLFA